MKFFNSEKVEGVAKTVPKGIKIVEIPLHMNIMEMKMNEQKIKKNEIIKICYNI